MRLRLLLPLLLAGCAQMEATSLAREGVIRVDPHPAGDDTRRVTIVAQEALASVSPVDPGTNQGRRALVLTLLGQNCGDMVEEGRIPMTPSLLGTRREQIILRVRCS